MPDDYLDADAIRAATFIRYVELHDTLGSTNDRATELVRDRKVELPALIAARNQTAGRGRGTHKWSADKGALTFSVLLNPKHFRIALEDTPKLSLATAVAICDALALEFHRQSEIDNPEPPMRVSIKWPNDIILDGAKLAGILIESPGGPPPANDHLIIGIGINVNNSWRNPAADVAGLTRRREKPANAITLCDATRRRHNTQQILINVLHALETRIDQLSARHRQLPCAWQQLCWLTEQEVEVQAGDTSITGICVGISRHGPLLVEDEIHTHESTAGPSGRYIARIVHVSRYILKVHQQTDSTASRVQLSSRAHAQGKRLCRPAT